MATLSTIFYASVQPNTGGPVFSIGSQSQAVTATVTDGKVITATVAATTGTLTLFDRAVAPAEFTQGDFFVVLPHASGFLCEVKSDGALPNYALFGLVSGFPFAIPDGVFYRDYGSIGGSAYTQFTSGTVAEIDTIAVKNTGSTAAQISFMVCKA